MKHQIKEEITTPLPTLEDQLFEEISSNHKSGTYLRFEAVNPEESVFRYYEVYLSRDLFRDYSVQTTYGKLGTHGRMKSYSFEFSDKAFLKLRSIIRKRLNSEKRIGCNYRLTKKMIR